MNYHVCVIRDRATDSFGTPIFVMHIGQAIRSFSDEINSKSKDSQLAQHPEDFDLYTLGTFNADTGLFDVGSPRQIAIGKDVLSVSQ